MDTISKQYERQCERYATRCGTDRYDRRRAVTRRRPVADAGVHEGVRNGDGHGGEHPRGARHLPHRGTNGHDFAYEHEHEHDQQNEHDQRHQHRTYNPHDQQHTHDQHSRYHQQHTHNQHSRYHQQHKRSQHHPHHPHHQHTVQDDDHGNDYGGGASWES